ncbi:hypothetical protein [Mycobacterium saskatchewanense]|nr:hypothetical protein [Mycobacterium saskatchewanense]
MTINHQFGDFDAHCASGCARGRVVGWPTTVGSVVYGQPNRNGRQ